MWAQLKDFIVTRLEINDPIYHPDLAKEYIEVPDDTTYGAAVYEGRVYNLPPYAMHFDPDLPGWIIDTERQFTEAKEARIAEIDAKTTALIRLGFEFDGQRFSMSEAAQKNWNAVGTALALGMMQFPYPISTVTEGSYILQSETALRQFLGTYMLYQADPSQPLGSGRALKERVSAAATLAELEAIIDDRA